MKADAKTEAAVIATMNQFAESYTKRDLQGVLTLFAPDADTILLGTGADEKRVGVAAIAAQAERDWSQSEALSVTYGSTSVSAAGAVAWAVADVLFAAKVDEQDITFTGRFTGVFENRDDQWLQVQAHYSLPATGQAEGESFPA
ncbi:MAG: nuclear transport factor 2 family protein [Caldilineaceae bacterium]